MRRLLPSGLKLRLMGLAGRFHPDRHIVARAFDAAWYRRVYPDIAETGVDPLSHFLVFGWKEGRDPNPDFSVREYLGAYPEAARSGVNPFVHFLTSGAAEVRAPRPDLGFRYEIIARQVPVEERLAPILKSPPAAQPQAVLDRALARSRTGRGAVHVTFSHDDFTAHVGGVQLALRREAARAAELGLDHLHIFPARPWPVVRDGEAGVLGVVWNGEAVGAFAPDAIVRALQAAPPRRATFAIHSLLGHEADETADILGAAGLSAGFFWLHDFASLCAGFHLLRNDVQDCAAPPPDSAACGVCVYGPWRARHLSQHERLFRRLKLTVVAPSKSALDLWSRAWDFPAAGTLVHPHATLVPRGKAPPVAADRPLRIAYAGLPAAHKGWPVFRDLALKHADDPRYEFFYFGARAAPDLPARFCEVAPGRMREALEAEAPDAVLVWPLCRETFSFVAYEAAAAGCAVVTWPDSGNVAAFVQETGHGLVLPDEEALSEAFETGALSPLARARRSPMLYDLAFGALTLDLVREDLAA